MKIRFKAKIFVYSSFLGTIVFFSACQRSEEINRSKLNESSASYALQNNQKELSSLQPALSLNEVLDSECADCQQAEAAKFETAESCGEDRGYLLKQLENIRAGELAVLDPQLPQKTPFYIQTPSASTANIAQVPRKCIAFTMKNFALDILKAAQTRSNSFGYCESDQGAPRPGNYAPCVTEDYVNVVYNSFIDIADCMDLPQKLILPKIFNESGFHLNAIAPLRVYAAGKIDSEPIPFPYKEEDPDQPGKTKFIPTVTAKINALIEKKLAEMIATGELNPKNFSSSQEYKTHLDELKQKFLKSATIIGGDSGLGQMTKSALLDVKENIQNAYTWSYILEAEKDQFGEFVRDQNGKIKLKKRDKVSDSCQRLKKLNPKLWSSDIQSDVKNRCSMVIAPPNPLRSLVYYGVLFKSNRRNIDNHWLNQKIKDRIEKINLSAIQTKDDQISPSDQQSIKDMLTLLSYNAGPGSSVVFFANWLDYRLDAAKIDRFKIQRKKDFDFGLAMPEKTIIIDFNKYAIVDGAKKYIEKPLYKLSSEELQNLKNEAVDLYKEIKQLQQQKAALDPQQTEQIADLEKQISFKKQRVNNIANFGIYNLSFPVYLRIYREGWAKGYLNYVKDFATKLDKNLGKGVCTSESFLSL
ncbi:MAG: hypothetical protein ACOYOK_05635 [Pseudobdellovibrionaceae bacterium]